MSSGGLYASNVRGWRRTLVATFLRNNDESDATDKGLKITIISVLPKEMDHHATTTTTASYQV